MSTTMNKNQAALEALCSLYRVEASLKTTTPLDVLSAISALEVLVGQTKANKYKKLIVQSLQR